MQRVVALRGLSLAFVLASLVYVGLRLGAFLPSSIGTYPDSGTYLHVADQSVLSGEFFAGWRGWTVPLLYKLLPDSDGARTAGQLAISIVSWLALAAVTAWSVQRSALRFAAFCLVLLFSLSMLITQWDRLILSESLSVSLAAAVLAAWLALARWPSRWTAAAVLATTLLWAFTRDTNAYVVLLTVPFVLGWIAWRHPGRLGVVLASGLVAIFVASTLSVSSSTAQPRWEFALLNVIGARVLTSDSELEYFRGHGMPVPDRLQRLAGEHLGSSDFRETVRDDPRLAPFHEWVVADGRATLILFLLTRPDEALAPVVRDHDALFSTNPSGEEAGGSSPTDSYRSTGTDPLLPAPLADALYPPSVAALLAWLGVVIVAAAWLASRGAARAHWLIPGIALLLQIPHAALVWHGDPVEIPRHALQVGLLTRLSLLVLTIFLIDAALGERDRKRSVAPRHATS